MRHTPRTLAVGILDRVEKGAFAEPLLDACLAKGLLPVPQDRGLLTQLVYGTLRLRNRIDWVIRAVYNGPLDLMEPGLRNILRVALYQIMCADRVPAYAATNEAVEMAKGRHPGWSKLINAILRNSARKMNAIVWPSLDDDPLSYISVVHSHPLWLVRLWVEQLGLDETRELCESNNTTPPLTVRTNGLKTDRPALIARLTEYGCHAVPTRYAPDGIILSDLPGPVRKFPPFREGKLQIQDEASQLISLLVDPKPGEAVLDVCAGAGIKATHLAQLMRNTGRIVAMDISRAKIESLQALARRLGVAIIEPLVHDATQNPPERLRGQFDRVLVDVPCSGLGTLRRNPEIRWYTAPEDLTAFPPLQREILNRSACYVKKGGSLVYSTCTILSAENEMIIREFLAQNPDFEYFNPEAAPAG
ncbi:MAG: 16S rRNA (cytosine(967)-C(5))-methyltransferase RsmB, partial [Syntrophaceae bacterium]|nr:16S rRNA (cytosine(967)-C(5))-methyltransferase RsmB [Syntrophaceae bacterium]